MPRAPKLPSKKRRVEFPPVRNEVEYTPLTPQEIGDEVEQIRYALYELGKRMERLTWQLLTKGVKSSPPTVNPNDDIPF